MNSLALLCNLHGEGPVTLAALRGIGCENLVGLEGVGDPELADLLACDEKGVQRFRREARILHQRIDGEEPEPAEEIANVEIAPVAPEPLRPAHAALDAAPQGEDPVVEAVLGLWRSFDHEPAGQDPVEAVVALCDVEINGLRTTELEALAEAGITTLEQLAAVDALQLSNEVGLAYTHLAHLSFLARKLHRQAAGMIPAQGAQAFRSEAAGDGAAGPFA